MDAIYKRRSIRKYTDKPVAKETVLELIKAGMNAPSAGNQQPWLFAVIDDRGIMNKITEIHPYSGMLKEAPVAILVCGNMKGLVYEDYWVQDCSAATENILLEIADRGLGGVWLGVYPLSDRVKGIRKLLNMPEEVTPFSLISLGYPAEEAEWNNKFEGSMIRYNDWKSLEEMKT